MESADQPYRFPGIQIQESTQRVNQAEADSELTVSRILLHTLLLLATAVTTMLTGAVFAVQTEDPAAGAGIATPFIAVLSELTRGNTEPLVQGFLFTFTLLAILGAHELGHYFACRYYGIRATLPFFIPAPPAITLFGTFGAVIKIKAPITSRRALFDIGIAGPLAGFAFALPASVIGLLFAKEAMPSSISGVTGGIQFHDPLLFVVIMKLFGLPNWIEWNPVYWASWGSLLVTALNLFPVGQLDGGHVMYALAGKRFHRWVSVSVSAAVVVLAALTFWLDQPPVYALWAIVLLFLLKVGHPPVIDQEPLGKARLAISVLALLVFLLCFMPFPITMM